MRGLKRLPSFGTDLPDLSPFNLRRVHIPIKGAYRDLAPINARVSESRKLMFH
jgi:hypothetical protein